LAFAELPPVAAAAADTPTTKALTVNATRTASKSGLLLLMAIGASDAESPLP
jgi:hypothetical protein